MFHSKDFKDTKGPFKDWTRKRKEALAIALFDVARDSGLIGMSKSVQRSLHKSFRKVGRTTHN
ncbi:MAG: hypothetical protein ACC619_06370, partial [Paracoccaceae bacterium]